MRPRRNAAEYVLRRFVGGLRLVRFNEAAA